MNTEVLVKEKVVEQEVLEHNLIVYNDDVNTFDHVIDSLIEICDHEVIQAEQCTHIIHYSGKCDVKSGEYDELVKMCSGLLDRGITAEVH